MGEVVKRRSVAMRTEKLQNCGLCGYPRRNTQHTILDSVQDFSTGPAESRDLLLVYDRACRSLRATGATGAGDSQHLLRGLHTEDEDGLPVKDVL